MQDTINPLLLHSAQFVIIKTYFETLQNELCNSLEKLETQTKFKKDIWSREESGGGQTRVISQGAVFEQAAVNFSYVYGPTLPGSATKNRPDLAGAAFQAMGVSLIVHPLNPYVPTTHFNLRFFIATKNNCEPVWWFGGGFDLTPYYPFEEDCLHWHQIAKSACQPFGETVYSDFKKNCDEYFYLKHRKEPRGIGGLFFDDLNCWSFETCFDFIQSVASHFKLAYFPIVETRKDLPFTEREKQFQLYRRGRYVEFNLIYDRGTLFGLHSGGRTESILASLPPTLRFDYNWHPEPNSPEARLYSEYLKIREWV